MRSGRLAAFAGVCVLALGCGGETAKKKVDKSADVIEVDVRKTKDGKAVEIDAVEVKTNSAGKVKEVDVEQVIVPEKPAAVKPADKKPEEKKKG